MRTSAKILISLLLLMAAASAQSFFGSNIVLLPSSPCAKLPQNWVNSNEWIGTTTNTIAFPSSGTGGAWSCGLTSYGPYTAGSQASAQQAITDAEACRTANGSGTEIDFPAGALYSGANGLSLPQTAGDVSANFIVLNSTTPLPRGRTVCSHGIQDNLSVSTDPGIRNLGCSGSNMSYQLGVTVTAVAPGAFTLANGTATNTSAYNDVASMWTVENTGANQSAISTATWDSNNVGPHHYAILNVEARPQAGLVSTNAPIAIGKNTETLTSQLPTHIHIAYAYPHGDWLDALPVTAPTAGPVGANSLPNDVAFNGCVNCSFTYSYIDKSLRPGAEGHGITQLLSQRTKKIHNWVEGQSIGAFCGGFSGAITLPNFVTCQDEEDGDNRYTYPYSWILAWQAGFKPNNGTLGYVRKNAHEYKFSENVLLYGNIFENVDDSGAQDGTIISFKTAQTSGGGLGTNYWTTQDNTTVINNIGRNSCNGPSFGDRSDAGGSNGGGVSLPAQNYLIQGNLFYNESVTAPGCNAGGNNAAPQYGWRIGSSVPGNVWAATVVRDGAGLTTTATLTSAPGLGVSDMAVGDPVTMIGCSDPSFNVGNTVMGPPALIGTLTNGLTVVYSNPGTASAGSGVTGCTLSSAQGWPNKVFFNHNTVIDDVSTSNLSNSANGGANIFPLARNFTVTNSILVNGGLNSTSGEGTRTSSRMFDPATEIFNNTLMPGTDGRVVCPGHSAGVGGMAACYTQYNYDHSAVTPTTLYGTPPAFCTGNDPITGNCAGILAGMSASSFPIVVSDWHMYRLCKATDAACNNKASLYSAGQANQASDTLFGDLGANMAAIEAAQTLNQYQCKTYCGLGGPYPDH